MTDRTQVAVDDVRTYADAVRSAWGLRELLSALRNYDAARDIANGDEPLDMTSLPTYGGEEPANTSRVWSWDGTHLLVGECIADMEIVPRQ